MPFRDRVATSPSTTALASLWQFPLAKDLRGIAAPALRGKAYRAAAAQPKSVRGPPHSIAGQTARAPGREPQKPAVDRPHRQLQTTHPDSTSYACAVDRSPDF